MTVYKTPQLIKGNRYQILKGSFSMVAVYHDDQFMDGENQHRFRHPAGTGYFCFSENEIKTYKVISH